MSIRMDKPAATGPEGDFLVLSDLPPGQVERRLAVIFSLGIVAVFFIIIGLSDNHPHPIPGFVLTFSTATRSPRSSYLRSFPFCVRQPSL
jgi:hypothetical protein